jgi:hypothetical protein
MKGSQRPCHSLDVLGIARIDDIEILRQPGRAVKDRGKAADNDELDTRSLQSPEELFVTRHRLALASRPALRNSSAIRWSSISFKALPV